MKIKKFLKKVFINAIALCFTTWFFPGLKIIFDLQTLFLSSFLLTLVYNLLKPAFNIIFLPLNLLTLGLFRCLNYTLALIITIFLVPGISLKPFFFEGFSFAGFSLPPFKVSAFFCLLLSGLILETTKKIIYFLLRD